MLKFFRIGQFTRKRTDPKSKKALRMTLMVVLSFHPKKKNSAVRVDNERPQMGTSDYSSFVHSLFLSHGTVRLCEEFTKVKPPTKGDQLRTEKAV
jgi:hypothetical protein